METKSKFTMIDEPFICDVCGREVKPMKEEAYFFKMSKYADKLLKYYEYSH